MEAPYNIFIIFSRLYRPANHTDFSTFMCDIMKQLIIKIVTLENALFSARALAENAAVSAIWITNKTSRSVVIPITGKIVWLTAYTAVTDIVEIELMDASEKATKYIIENIERNLNILSDSIQSNLVHKSNTILEAAHKITSVAYDFVMKDYSKIATIIHNILEVKIQINSHKINPINVVNQFITFSDGEIKELHLMNQPARIFYFFKVHEIISLVGDIVGEKILMSKFWQLLVQVDDFELYSRFFISDIKLKSLNKIMSNIPTDIIKLIIDYCHLTIHSSQDLDILSIAVANNFKVVSS